MPIRFRCAYCSQLMSIATRKAGTVIRCTKCAGEIIVPRLEEDESTQPAPSLDPGQAFESANFDVELSSTQPTAPEPPPPPPKSEPRTGGIFLSIAMLLVSIGVVVLLLILVFVAGFFIGRM